MALSKDAFDSFGGAAGDLFSAAGSGFKVFGNLAEAGNYRIAADMARENEKFSNLSTAVKLAQAQRDIYKSESSTVAGAAGAGLATSGSVSDILAESATQGELHKQILSEQGYIQRDAYEAQAKSYDKMAESADMAAIASGVSGAGSVITGGIKGLSGLASLGLFAL